jgi:hypothetical protein
VAESFRNVPEVVRWLGKPVAAAEYRMFAVEARPIVCRERALLAEANAAK